MDTNYTHIAMIIDRSGSMAEAWSDVNGGYTQIVKENKKQDDKCTFTVAAFDTEYSLIEDFTDIKEVKEELSVTPRGGTALLDAIGNTIVAVGERLASLPENDRPAKVCVIVQTDGEENSSRRYTKEMIKELITNQTEVYNWQFQFIGASLDSVTDAHSYGFTVSNSSTYNEGNSQTVFMALGEKMKNMRSVSVDKYATSACFTDEERDVLNSDATTSTI